MNIKKVKIKNFRSYRNETTIDFDNLNVFVGKNDVGKSTILEALDIFINENKGVVKLDKDDINKQGLAEDDNEIVISVTFDELPTSLILDTSNTTTLANEHLLTGDGKLEIIKRYINGGKEKVYIKASHPTNSSCSDLLLKKQNDLKKIIETNSIECSDRTRNAVMRSTIWSHFSDDLQLAEVEIDVTKADVKSIWEQLKKYLPLYTLFQSDRKNSDGDSEIQDPMKLAVQEILKDESLQESLNTIAAEVEEKLKEVAEKTLEKLNEMNPEIASTLNPVIPSADSLKWADVFKNVSISGDEDIPINKRGSGVKRLVLLNFFRAEAEKRKADQNVPNIIYAIEEPETSQHPNHQRKLIEAFIELSNAPHTQIILTTHSPSIVKLLDFDHLKLIRDGEHKEVTNIERSTLLYPSLNEVNYLAFNESNEEYHNELYSCIEIEGKLGDFRQRRTTRNYIRLFSNGNTRNEQKDLSEYIRHQIHHPENTHNTRFTHDELQQSIGDMKNFIETHIQ